MAAQSILPLQIPRLDVEPTTVPAYAESPCLGLEACGVFDELRRIDWAFTEDDTSFLAHDVHPYPAKFIPQIPGNLISMLSGRGEVVLDPFGGSGTTALEAIRLGRRAICIDANPLSALIGRVKTSMVDRASAIELHGFQAALASELPSLPSNPESLIATNREHAPTIPNREKWFADSAFGELCLIKKRIMGLESACAKDIALVAMSKIAIRASFQDSETRYKSVPRQVPVGETLRRYLKEFRSVVESVSETESTTRHGIARFIYGDSRYIGQEIVPDGSVDLVVTSPPYGNATDYHLYHRFRLLWLGFDPIELSKREIGSHLKHQREGSGFASYFDDLRATAKMIHRVLRPGRYAALVLGDSVYEGKRYDPAVVLEKEARELGFDAACIIDRSVHAVKRSFAHAGRRATKESILILRKEVAAPRASLAPPPYKLWPYERTLRLREAGLGIDGAAQDPTKSLAVNASPATLHSLRNLVFSHAVVGDGCAPEPTWQATIENGGASNPAARKDPKYVTHGLHPYKGKFYPQLAKGLLNISGLSEGSRVFDPFCGSGTTLLECYLNGFKAFGCDMNPLAARIARAKTEILECDPDLLTESVTTLLDAISCKRNSFARETTAFKADCLDEIRRWFPEPVIYKLNWLMRTISKNSGGAVLNFMEVVLSSIVRDVSQQEPSDLRIRYRKDMIADADVLGLFKDALLLQFGRIEKFWNIRGMAPCQFRPARAIRGDNRNDNALASLGIEPGTIDAILTSPPYATALPYIDTDRLSLLVIDGISSTERRPIENELTGSREIGPVDRRKFEASDATTNLPKGCQNFVADLSRRLKNDSSAGFRKLNMPALLARYLLDMRMAIGTMHTACKTGGEVMIVIGDNRTEVGGKFLRIPTTDFLDEIATAIGFEPVERIDISVTIENYLHQKNAITENVVLRLRKVKT